jgi:monomeric sarcosine oxidase
LSQLCGKALLFPVGVLQVGPRAGRVLPGVLASARQHGLAVDELSANDLSERFPGFRISESLGAVFERNAGYLLVEECVLAHVQQAIAHGAALHIGETVLGWRGTPKGVEVTTDRGTYSAGSLVITAGAWAGPLLADLGVPLQVVRKSLYWYAADDAGHHQDQGTPGFIFETPEGNFYGFPKRDAAGIKVAEHTGGEMLSDPLKVNRAPIAAETARVEAFLGNYLPGVTREAKGFATCLYTLSPDRNFLVDRHPECGRVSFAAGLSGHGFKFTSVLGEVLADLAIEGETRLPIGFLSVRRPGLRGLAHSR